MSSKPRQSWLPHKIARLKELWAAGVTGLNIAKALNVTRNAVIGKANRLGLEPRPSPIKPRAPGEAKAKPKPRKPRSAAAKGSRRESALVKRVKNTPSRLPAVVTARCQWIDGPPTDSDDCKCMQTSAAGSYCLAHYARSVVPNNRRAEAD